MRILHIVEVELGGVISVVNSFAEWQLEEGHDVHVLAPGKQPRSWGPDILGSHHAVTPLPILSRSYRLRKTVAEVDPDVIHLHSFFPGAFGRVLPFKSPPRPAIIYRPAVVYQPHSWAFDAVPSRLGRSLTALWERFAARRTDGFVVNCQDELDEGLAHGVKMSGDVVGVPIDTEHYAVPTDITRRQVREELGVSGQTVLLCVGRLSKQKGQDRLAGAWMQSPIPGAVLVFLGAGDQRQLKAIAGSEWNRSIRAPGPVQDVRKWLHAADLFVSASRWEGQAVAVAEALACGLPAVATNVNGAHDAIADPPCKPAGVVIDQGDMAAFLLACRRRVSNPQLVHDESVAARVRAEQLFARNAVMMRVTDAYTHAMASKISLSSKGG